MKFFTLLQSSYFLKGCFFVVVVVFVFKKFNQQLTLGGLLLKIPKKNVKA